MEASEIVFAHKGHEKFYQMQMRRKAYQQMNRRKQARFQAFFYLIGFNKETRKNVDDLFDFSKHTIRPQGLYCEWQTTDTLRITRLAFNLFSGWTEKGLEFLSSPYHTFNCRIAPFLVQAVMLRYPDCFQTRYHK